MGTLIYIWDAPGAELATWLMAIFAVYDAIEYNTHADDGTPRQKLGGGVAYVQLRTVAGARPDPDAKECSRDQHRAAARAHAVGALVRREGNPYPTADAKNIYLHVFTQAVFDYRAGCGPHLQRTGAQPMVCFFSHELSRVNLSYIMQ